jgi:anti-sigma regulatory factor (Ser/Thr protein kinase)
MNRKGDSKVFRLEIPGEPDSLELVSLVVAYLAAEAGFAAREMNRIEFAVDEACSNVIAHAYRAIPAKPPIQLVVTMNPAWFQVDVIDHGTPMDYASYTPPKFPDHWDQANVGGVGLYVIQQCMDETQYDTLPDKSNRLRLIKRAG